MQENKVQVYLQIIIIYLQINNAKCVLLSGRCKVWMISELFFEAAGWMSRLLKLLFSLSMIASSLSCTTSSRRTSLQPTADPALMSLFSLFASLALMPAPQDTTEEDGARNNRLIKHLEHLQTLKDLSLKRAWNGMNF